MPTKSNLVAASAMWTLGASNEEVDRLLLFPPSLPLYFPRRGAPCQSGAPLPLCSQTSLPDGAGAMEGLLRPYQAVLAVQ